MTAVFLIKIASARGSGGNFGGVWVVFGGGLLGQHFGFTALHIAGQLHDKAADRHPRGGIHVDIGADHLTANIVQIVLLGLLQVTLKEKFIGTGSGNLTELEKVINEQAAKGYRLHTISTTSSGSKGIMGGDRIQATMVFEKLG